jgi:hypothetical protein
VFTATPMILPVVSTFAVHCVATNALEFGPQHTTTAVTFRRIGPSLRKQSQQGIPEAVICKMRVLYAGFSATSEFRPSGAATDGVLVVFRASYYEAAE